MGCTSSGETEKLPFVANTLIQIAVRREFREHHAMMLSVCTVRQHMEQSGRSFDHLDALAAAIVRDESALRLLPNALGPLPDGTMKSNVAAFERAMVLKILHDAKFQCCVESGGGVGAAVARVVHVCVLLEIAECMDEVGTKLDMRPELHQHDDGTLASEACTPRIDDESRHLDLQSSAAEIEDMIEDVTPQPSLAAVLSENAGDPISPSEFTCRFPVPAGEWIACVEEPDFLYSFDEHLYFHRPTGHFVDPDTNGWYVPDEGRWVEEDEYAALAAVEEAVLAAAAQASQ